MLGKLFSLTAFAEPAATAAPEAINAIEQATEAAESISPMTVFGFGFGLVFVGLIAIIIICKIMGAVCQLFIKENKASAPKEKKAKSGGKLDIPNKGEFVAAVSAALAEEMGKDVSAIRILSIKKL